MFDPFNLSLSRIVPAVIFQCVFERVDGHEWNLTHGKEIRFFLGLCDEAKIGTSFGVVEELVRGDHAKIVILRLAGDGCMRGGFVTSEQPFADQAPSPLPSFSFEHFPDCVHTVSIGENATFGWSVSVCFSWR